MLRVEGPTREAVFYTRTGDHVTHALEHGYYEADLLAAIAARAVRGDYIDVGAHIGNHTVFFALECRARRVLAIEPNPESFVQLCANVVANGLCGRVDCLNAAIHPEWLTAKIVPGPSGNSGMASVGPSGAIPVLHLDDFRNGHVGLIKVDTEGSSREVLETATEILHRDHPLIAYEAVTEAEHVAVQDFLAQFDYKDWAGPYAYTPVYLCR